MLIKSFSQHATRFLVLSACFASSAIIASACSAGSGPGGDGSGDEDRDGSGGLGNGLDPGTGAGGGSSASCADGILQDDEACDDGNSDSGDGCAAGCLVVEPGFICRTPGEACVPFAKCGDGITVFPEQCDDGARTAGDGCNDNCKLELGYKCEPDDAGKSVCSHTTCGDDLVEGAEMCEPGLESGCTSQCQYAPTCGDSGPCTSECGDGLVLGEACDDGNRLGGDGCDENCAVEPGYECATETSECEKNAAGDCILRIPVTYRDFAHAHSDFGPDSCGTPGVKTNLVETTLSGGKPVKTTGADCTSKLEQWYVDSAEATTFHSELVLYENAAGNYVNRWGTNGEPFYWTLGWSGATNCAIAPGCGPYDGTPFFYPVDGIPNAKDDGGGETAAVSDEDGIYGGDGTTRTELALTGSGPKHNYSFTSEIAYWFAFEETTDASFQFVGDDDVWVFVNGQRAIDLGGKHAAEAGSFTLDGSSPTFGMETGNVYEIKVFHAERQANGSTFKLTLSGFDTRRSDCRADCGDGIIGFGEECDDGDAGNTGGYNHCNQECQLGAYCGDGIVQEGETCDDRDPATQQGCAGCRRLVVR